MKGIWEDGTGGRTWRAARMPMLLYPGEGECFVAGERPPGCE
ncbi:MAG: hypothetical protein ACYCO9_12340 [Streptosporangiaceae bacterium]